MFFAVTPSFITFVLYLLFPLGVYAAFKSKEASENYEKYQTTVLLITILLCADIVFYLLFRSEIEGANTRLLLLFHTFAVLAGFALSRTIKAPQEKISTELYSISQPPQISPKEAKPERGIKKPLAPLVVEQVSVSWHGMILSEELKNGIEFAIHQKHFPLLLSGPAGNGRETIAKIIASILKLKFTKIDLSRLVGSDHEETEGIIEASFASIKSSAPILVYIPEIHRIFAWNKENWVSSRAAMMIQEFLVSSSTQGVTAVASTDNQDSMKEWMLQSESFEAIIEVPLLTPNLRIALAKEGFKGFVFEDEIEWDGFQLNTLGRSAKDILWVIEKTKQLAAKRANNLNNTSIKREDLALALEELLKNPP